MLLTSKLIGRLAELYEALVYSTNHFGGVDLSPRPDILSTLLHKLLYHFYWTLANYIFYHHPCYWQQNIHARWQSCLRSWFKVPFTSMEWVRVPLQSFCWNSYTKCCLLYFEHLHMVSSTVIHAFDHQTYRQDDQVIWGAGIRHQSLVSFSHCLNTL